MFHSICSITFHFFGYVIFSRTYGPARKYILREKLYIHSNVQQVYSFYLVYTFCQILTLFSYHIRSHNMNIFYSNVLEAHSLSNKATRQHSVPDCRISRHIWHTIKGSKTSGFTKKVTLPVIICPKYACKPTYIMIPWSLREENEVF